MATPTEEKKIIFVETTDVHGNYFPHDFISRTEGKGSLARVHTFVDSLRSSHGANNILLLDCGDILQGQPTAYYYNFIDTTAQHPASAIYDFMDYDAATIGNHDVETGHNVYDRWISQTVVPIMGANVIDIESGQPYLKPYTTIMRDSVKICILGLLTPAIPAWLPENLWSGLRFDDMTESASKWVAKIRREENPDVMVGLFHSGGDSTRTTDSMMENASLWIANNVPGFDIIFFGHDHQVYSGQVKATGANNHTIVLNPANNARNVAIAELTLRPTDNGKYEIIERKGMIKNIEDQIPSAEFMAKFTTEKQNVENFTERIIATCADSITTREALFGPSAFMQLVHELQLTISGADVSFAAPLSFDAKINKGNMRVSDMFTLYKYENMLYTMKLSGKEIKNYLEMSYDLWSNQISPDETNPHLLKYSSPTPTPAENRLKNPVYNFDSAYGIDYTVDITKPRGERISITGFTDSRKFSEDEYYSVAINSYRGNGGGDLLTEGAGIPRKELKSRILRSTDKDLRYYFLKEVENRRTIKPQIVKNWKFIPENTAEKASHLDKLLLFSADSSEEQK